MVFCAISRLENAVAFKPKFRSRKIQELLECFLNFWTLWFCFIFAKKVKSFEIKFWQLQKVKCKKNVIKNVHQTFSHFIKLPFIQLGKINIFALFFVILSITIMEKKTVCAAFGSCKSLAGRWILISVITSSRTRGLFTTPTFLSQ